jgi:hypothetical protein
MTTAPPPEFYFESIDFNPEFFEDVSATLTKKECDERYLIKTEQDTATALQTFTGGIKTNSIEPINATDTLNIATISSTATNVINIGNTTTNEQTLNLNSKTINMGDTSVPSSVNILSSSVIIGTTSGIIKFGSSAVTTQITASTSSLNISNVGPADNDFNLCPVQNAGILFIGNSTARTGAINIATAKTTSSVQPINIGSSNVNATGQTININRPLTIGYTASVGPSSFSQIGYFNQSSGSSTSTLTSGNNVLVHSVSSIPDGTYIIIGNITCLGTGCTITLQEFGITTVTPPIPTGALTYYPSASVKTSNTFIPANGTYIVNFNTVCKITGGTIFLSSNTTYTGGAFSLQGRLIITRIG